MANLEIDRDTLTLWGFTPEEIDFILDPTYIEASRVAKAQRKAMKGLVMERVDEINRILAPVGLSYEVRDIRAE